MTFTCPAVSASPSVSILDSASPTSLLVKGARDNARITAAGGVGDLRLDVRTDDAVRATPKATAAWFDADADGSRDAVLAVNRRGAGKVASLSLLENIGPAGHWLEVELTGPPGNRQAIGARVSAAAHGRTQTQWVGQNDGSHLSQGHYRLYFGLGGATSASVKVTWPNGSVQRLGSVEADRILRVSQGK